MLLPDFVSGERRWPERPRLPVVFLPGGVTPVQPSYAPLIEEMGDEIQPLLKDLEVYADDTPPPGYSIEMEVEGALRAADRAGFETFHLVGYSGGGAVSLDLVATHPERVRSLALFEPANLMGSRDDFERAWDDAFQRQLRSAPPDRMVAEFTRLHLRPEAELPAPPPGPPPDWMAKRPAGLRAMMAAFEEDSLDRGLLRSFRAPVYLAHGELTADYMIHRVQVLAGLLPDLWIEAYARVHHFVPPQRSQPARYARSLRSLWARAESRSAAVERTADPSYAA
jgi:pimeloyl-ACP methyl ester carboxylesterase